MTLQEKIKKKAEGFGKLAPAFLEDAKFALENQWISVKEDLPYKHENLLVGNETVLVVVADIFGNVDTDFMTYANGAWGWWSNSNAAYWLPLPEFTND